VNGSFAASSALSRLGATTRPLPPDGI